MSNPAFSFDHIHIMSRDPAAAAKWYEEMFGARIVRNAVSRDAPQIFVELGGMTLIIRGRRAGEEPVDGREIRPFSDFSSHNTWGTDHFGFMYKGDLTALCDELRARGVKFPVELKRGEAGSLLCYVSAPDGVSIELMEC